MKQELVRVFFALIRSAVTSEPLTEEQKSILDGEALAQCFALSKKHDLSHLVGYALEKNGVAMGETEEKFNRAQMLSVFRHEQMRYDYGEICRLLEAAGLDFLPLKGSLIRPYYPEEWMRTSCDVDVLIHPEDTEGAVALLEQSGWRTEGEKNFHDVSLYSPTGTHLELHFTIRENLPSLDPVLDTVWEHSRPVEEGRKEHRQSHAFLLFHLLAHMSYHFINGGCGVRSVLDLWILRDHLHPDEEELAALCKAAGLERFRLRLSALIDRWFEDKADGDDLMALEDFLLSGGVFGSTQNRVKLDQAKAGGKGKNLLSRIFMPMDKLKAKYPALQKRPWLMPVYQLRRWLEMLRKGRLSASVKEMKLNSEATKEEIQDAEAFLKDLGLLEEKK